MKKLLLTGLMFIACATLTGCYEVADGEKIGMITKVSQQGIFCKTWEAEIIRGGFNGGSGVNGQSFHFTIEDPKIVKQIQEAMEKQHEIKIHYKSEMISFCRSESHSTFLTSMVKISNNEKTDKPTEKSTQNTNNHKISVADNEKIIRLLQVQAELINELAKK